MMTDDERREVARKMRETAEYGVYVPIGFLLMDMLDTSSSEKVLTRLAELIDPAESGQNQDKNGTCRDESGQCPKATRKCDRDALLALAKEMDETDCDEIGVISVDLGTIWGWAQAIRDAVGGNTCSMCNLMREVAMADSSRICVCDGGSDELEQVSPYDAACDKFEER